MVDQPPGLQMYVDLKTCASYCVLTLVKVPRIGEGSFPILPAQFPQQIQAPSRFGINQTFDRSMRAQFQPESREAQINRDNQGQGTQFNAQSNVEGCQMHASVGADNKEQQEMQYKGTEMVENPKNN